MNRVVIAEESLQDQIGDILKSEKQQIGLLIGQLTANKHYVVYMIKTPSEDDENEKENEAGTMTAKEKAKKKKKKPSEEETEEVGALKTTSDSWIGLHAKQVQRMLPGGLDVIGVYAAAPQSVMEKALTRLRQIIYAVYKILNKNSLITTTTADGFSNERIVLQICQTTRKVLCKTFDGENRNDSLRASDFKYQTSLTDRWLTLHTRVAVDHSFVIPVESKSEKFFNQLQSGLSDFSENVQASVGTVDGILRDSNEPLFVPKQTEPTGGGGGKKKGGKKQQQQNENFDRSQLSFNVDLFLQMLVPTDPAPVQDIVNRFHMRGTMQARAFVHNKATVKEGLQALKTDIIRGMKARCDLLYEDLLDAKEDDTSSTAMETPMRVFTHLPGQTCGFCDYLFTDETPQDVIDRCREILDLDLDLENIETNLEKQPDMNELESSEDEIEGKKQNENQPASDRNYTGLLIGGAVSVLAAAISYLFVGQES
ncbi:protein odr-4 homolog [Tubulanus polymorphus]|uniref:protein odr-4 homolog n=1 Tax=Tubulanus polymorphus TaxID=672921 RepID=UPI003DA530C0